MKFWIFLHHKCASQYLRAAISAAGQAAGQLTSISAMNSIEEPPDTGSVRIAMAQSDYSLDDNAWPEVVNLIDLQEDNWRGIHFVRDPRDLLVSAYWSHRTVHPLNFSRLRAHREALQQVGLETGLLMEMDFYLTKAAIEHILYWPEHPNVLTFDAIDTVRDLSSRREDRRPFRQALMWIDIPLLASMGFPSWRAVSGRSENDEAPGGRDEDNTHHYRHGVQGDWQRYFTLAVRTEFNRRYGEALAAKGYGDTT